MAKKRRGLLLLLALWAGFCGCESALPAPTVAPPKTLSLNDSRFDVLVDLSFSCQERMEQMAHIYPCSIEQSALGPLASCPLDLPFASLRYGCGPKPEQAPSERLILSVRQGEGPLLNTLAREVLGPCDFAAMDSIDGTLRACFFKLSDPTQSVQSSWRRAEGGRLEQAMGVFLSCDQANRCEELRLETRLFKPSERKIVHRSIIDILALGSSHQSPEEL